MATDSAENMEKVDGRASFAEKLLLVGLKVAAEVLSSFLDPSVNILAVLSLPEWLTSLCLSSPNFCWKTVSAVSFLLPSYSVKSTCIRMSLAKLSRGWMGRISSRDIPALRQWLRALMPAGRGAARFFS